MNQAKLTPITSLSDVYDDLAQLVQLDPRLKPVLDTVIDVPLRLKPGGFEGIARIVMGQLLSVASASAISKRLAALVQPLTAQQYLATDQQQLLACGLSNSKMMTLTGLAKAELSGELSFQALHTLSVVDAHKVLCGYKGIGPWTAQVYLLFCVGHRDIFPSGDLALQKATAHALDLTTKPDSKSLDIIALNWSPYRGSAARLLWAYFAYLKQREGLV